MAKSLCILHANCQGEAIQPLLECSPEFSRFFEIRHFHNYTREKIPAADLSACRLFLGQYLGSQWQEISTEQLLPKLGKNAESLIIPNFFFKGYWPFWSNASNVIEFEDALLEDLLAKGLDDDIILNLYLRLSPALAGDPEKIAQASLEQEKEKEKQTPIKYVDFLEENWRKRQLFLTINHPGMELLGLAAQEILRLLDLPPISQQAIDRLANPQDEFWLPIHPKVGEWLKLPFASPGRHYNCFGQLLTHREYIVRYLACRRYGIANLTGVLKTLALKDADPVNIAFS